MYLVTLATEKITDSENVQRKLSQSEFDDYEFAMKVATRAAKMYIEKVVYVSIDEISYVGTANERVNWDLFLIDNVQWIEENCEYDYRIKRRL